MSVITEELNYRGRELESVSDAIDDGISTYLYVNKGPFRWHWIVVNILKGAGWNEKSGFDENQSQQNFRDYDGACDRVKNFYRQQHSMKFIFLVLFTAQWSWFFRCAENQTVEFNLKARAAFRSRKRVRMSVWQAIELLNTLVDESDPDVGGFYLFSKRPLLTRQL